MTEGKTMETGEMARHCFVRHHDAGGLCMEPASMEVHGIVLCARHGEEARIGAALEECHDAENFFNRLRNPEATPHPPAVARGLQAAINGSVPHVPADEDHYRALRVAYPELPEETRRQLDNWVADADKDEFSPLDVLLDELHAIHRLMRTAEYEPIGTWVLEVLEQERQRVAAQAAYLLRNP